MSHHFQTQIGSLQDKTTLQQACMSKEHTAKASSHLPVRHHQVTRMFKAVGQACGMCRMVSNERPSLAFNLAMHCLSFEPSKLRLKANHQIIVRIDLAHLPAHQTQTRSKPPTIPSSTKPLASVPLEICIHKIISYQGNDNTGLPKKLGKVLLLHFNHIIHISLFIRYS